MPKPVILAVDPGYDRCGWAVLSGSTALDLGCIETRKSDDFFARLNQVLTYLSTTISTYSPQHLAIETLFFSKNVTTALRVAEVRGAISGLCLHYQMRIFEYTPVQIKLAVTGNGKADKKAVEKMVRLQLHLDKSTVLLDDTLDALGIGLTHCVSHGVY